ncbi:transmembrane protein, putative [Medicago truncatula]|uniref:Transmembrane protein, putative n=1 Tax=Medicago truncatula TaxID=3880 RepID=G7IZM9_MEDTR|nr:transmembrane protein, putative [Medicago truncatula]
MHKFSPLTFSPTKLILPLLSTPQYAFTINNTKHKTKRASTTQTRITCNKLPPPSFIINLLSPSFTINNTVVHQINTTVIHHHHHHRRFSSTSSSSFAFSSFAITITETKRSQPRRKPSLCLSRRLNCSDSIPLTLLSCSRWNLLRRGFPARSRRDSTAPTLLRLNCSNVALLLAFTLASTWFSGLISPAFTLSRRSG